ncbi:phage tail tape measure protein, partial [Streptomyces parvulus]|uniref:phage tail tape measure protein n=1 Tax=Streptomyces parvulus TaxID=146923 RepID=UPI00340148FF
MPLTVGELHAVLAVDDRAVDPALRRAENAMRSAGRQMGADAARAGDDAGQHLGDGIARTATGRLRDARGRFRAAGRAAGDALGDGIADGAGDGADQAVDQAGGKMERLKQVAGGAAMAAGAAAGALLVSAFSEALDQGQMIGKMQAQLGITPQLAQRYGKVAGDLYKGAITDSVEDGIGAVRSVAAAGLIPPNATQAQIKTIATSAADLARSFDVDFADAAQAAGIAVKTGLAKNSTEAFDLITRGMAGLDKGGEDFLETISEYGVQFAKSGLSGRTALGLMRQAVQAGWKDTDKLADAFKELELRVTGGEKAQIDALKSIGLNADEMIAALSAGGQRGEDAMAQIHDAIVELGPESSVAKKAIQELFGGPGEDLGAAFFKLNLHEAQKAMSNTAGSTRKLGDALRDNAGTRVKQFRNTVQQNLVEFLGGPVLGSVEGFKRRLGSIWTEAGQAADGEGFANRVVAFMTILGTKLAEKAVELAPKMIQGIAMAGQRVAEWVMANPMQVLKIAAIAGAVLIAFSALPALIGAGLGVVATTLIWGFVSRLVEGAGSALGGLGSAIGGWFSGLWSRYVAGPTSRTWNSFIGSVKALPGRAGNALSGLGGSITARAVAAWTSFRNATVSRALSMVSWVKGLPSRISAGMGSLTGLLTGKGRNVVQGLWNGISSMGGWIRSKLTSWAKSMIPGPIAKALGIASPSKVTAAQGRWIARGLIDGLTGSSKQVRAASYKLVDIVKDSLSGKKERKALARINKDAGWLDWLAKRDATVTGQLKTAQKKLDDLRKTRDKLSADVKNGILGEADITKQDTGGFQSADNILMNLREDTRAAQQFAVHLAALKKKGVRSDLISQIAQA